MCHDPIAGRALRGIDGGDPGGTDVAVGDVAHVESLPLAALHADHDQPLLGVDREHLCGAPVEALGGIVLADKLDALAGTQSPWHLGEIVCLGAAAVSGGPGERLVLGVEQADGAGLGVDGCDAVAGVAARRAVLAALAERHDMAGTVAGGTGALRLSQPERFEYRHGHGPRLQRAVADQFGADGVGERLAPPAGGASTSVRARSCRDRRAKSRAIRARRTSSPASRCSTARRVSGLDWRTISASLWVCMPASWSWPNVRPALTLPNCFTSRTSTTRARLSCAWASSASVSRAPDSWSGRRSRFRALVARMASWRGRW